MAYKILDSHNFLDSTDAEGTTAAPTTAAPPPATAASTTAAPPTATDTPTDGIYMFLLIRALTVALKWYNHFYFLNHFSSFSSYMSRWVHGNIGKML